MNGLLVLIFGLASIFSSSASNNGWDDISVDTSFSCNDLVQISLDENCEVDLNADMIIEGFNGDLSEFDVEILDEAGYLISNPINGDYMGDTLYITAIHEPSEKTCWGRALIEDKWNPSLTCANYVFECYEQPNGFPLPIVQDNCDSNPSLILLSENIDKSDMCSLVTFTRTYVAVDQSGNESPPCTQLITASPPILPTFPSDTIWSCEIYQEHPNIIQPKKLTGNLNSTGSGVPDVSLGDFCPYNVTHSDFFFDNDCGETFTILRVWTVINWCTDEIITIGANGEDNKQYIKVEDQTPPSVERPPFTVNANIGSAANEECGSTSFLLPPLFIDDCNNVTTRILTGVGEAIYIGEDGSQGGFIPFPGLPLGEHTVIYEAQDECGNVDSVHVTVIVADMTAPVTICDELTNVSLGIEGETSISAYVFDDGSRDNCCLDGFKVRRMEGACNPLDTLFQDSVFFCCTDVGDTVQVVFGAFDCSGNLNECMVLVEVEEKLPPYLVSCPASEKINCDFYIEFLEIPLTEGNDSVLLQFGEPIFNDNCELIYIENSTTVDLDQCQQGTITRKWRVTDPGQNAIVECMQIIEVEHFSDWLVEFPSDLDIDCGEELPDTGEPVVFNESCELIAVSYEDEVFTIIPNACYKIARTWTVINWCTVGNEIDNPLVESPEDELIFDLNYDLTLSDRLFKDGVNVNNFSQQASQFGAQPDGVVVFQQEISVLDQVSPVVNCLPYIEICIEDTTCMADFELPFPDILDCGISINVTATGDLGVGLGPFIEVPLGTYGMTYQVDDNCGNSSFCETEVEVKDCKKPTPFCQNGLIIELDEDSIIIVNAEIFNAGSFDNCPGELIFSFSMDPSDSLAIFDCSTLGYQNVEIWLTDASGNQDFCATFVFVEDNDGVCSGVPLVNGNVQTVISEGITGVSITNNSQMATITDSDGNYSFESAVGEDLTLSATKNTHPLNGLTTYDIVLISKHILGVELLDSPYKILAADANLSNTVTTSDLVALRKLILQINTELPHGKSWRFIDGKYSFPNPLNPFGSPIKEVLNFNNLSTDILDADLLGIKIGDVNMSADPSY